MLDGLFLENNQKKDSIRSGIELVVIPCRFHENIWTGIVKEQCKRWKMT